MHGAPRPARGGARYDTIGVAYARRRREEPTWAAAIARSLGGARRVVNVGAGSGNYEPRAAQVVAVEPSATMVSQRDGTAAPAVRGVAEALPFGDGTFDAALAVLTTHHWADLATGLAELARVAPRQVVVTWDPTVSARFWLHRDYLPALRAREASLPSLDAVVAGLDVVDVAALEVPRQCVDGFLGAWWDEPEAYLDPTVRAAMSGLSLLDQGVVDEAMAHLAADVADGTWHRRNADLAGRTSLDAGFRLVRAGH